MTNFEEIPDGIVIFIRRCVIGVVPVHKIAKTLALFGLDLRIFFETLFAKINKLIYAKFFNIFFVFKTKFFFDFDFDPKALFVKTVLKSLLVPLHIKKALPEILVSSAPSMVNTHRIIGSNGAVK